MTNGEFYKSDWSKARDAWEFISKHPGAPKDVFEWLDKSPADTAAHIPNGTLVQFGPYKKYGVVVEHYWVSHTGYKTAYEKLKIRTASGFENFDVECLIEEPNSMAKGCQFIGKASIDKSLLDLLANECPLKKPACME